MSGVWRPLQIIAKGIVAVEMALLPAFFLAFVLPDQIASIGIALGIDFGAVPDLWSLRDQQAFFANHGLSSPQVIYSLHICGIAIPVTIAVILLRLVSGPLLFDMIDTRAILVRKHLSLRRFILSCLFIGVAGTWMPTHFNSSQATGVLKALVYLSPRLYIALNALSFVFGAMGLVEGTLGCIQLFLTRKRESNPTPSISN